MQTHFRLRLHPNCSVRSPLENLVFGGRAWPQLDFISLVQAWARGFVVVRTSFPWVPVDPDRPQNCNMNRGYTHITTRCMCHYNVILYTGPTGTNSVLPTKHRTQIQARRVRIHAQVVLRDCTYSAVLWPKFELFICVAGAVR